MGLSTTVRWDHGHWSDNKQVWVSQTMARSVVQNGLSNNTLRNLKGIAFRNCFRTDREEQQTTECFICNMPDLKSELRFLNEALVSPRRCRVYVSTRTRPSAQCYYHFRRLASDTIIMALVSGKSLFKNPRSLNP
jgi:hypothetical protein